MTPNNLFPQVCHTLYYGKYRPKAFLYWREFLSFSKICVFKNLLGPTELILSLPQFLSENLGDPYKLFPKVCQNG